MNFSSCRSGELLTPKRPLDSALGSANGTPNEENILSGRPRRCAGSFGKSHSRPRYATRPSTSHNAEYKNAQEKLDQQQETVQRQREQLEEMDLMDGEVERALEPMISFRVQLREEIETYEQMRRGDLSALHDLRSIGRWLIGARIAKGWSLSRLADELDVSVQQVSRDEQNEYDGITTRRAPPRNRHWTDRRPRPLTAPTATILYR